MRCSNSHGVQVTRHWTEQHEDLAMGRGRRVPKRATRDVKTPTDRDLHPLMDDIRGDRFVEPEQFGWLYNDTKYWCVVWQAEPARE